MTPRLIGAGHTVTGWNRTREKAAPLLERGMRWADSPCEAASLAFSIVPPLWAEPGEEIIFALDPIDTVPIRFAPKGAPA